MEKKERYRKFFRNFSDFIFVADEPQKADVIFVPGNGFPQMAEHAAALWKEGFAPYVLPSGRYSVTDRNHVRLQPGAERYGAGFSTEWAFLHCVLRENGVPESAILKEEYAEYTYQNAIYSRQVTDQKGLLVRRALICCKAQHARRCLLYYQLLYPEAEILICPSDVGINRENWMETDEGIDEVLGEIERCGAQFHQIMRKLKSDGEKW